jgi:hypothetical protein
MMLAFMAVCMASTRCLMRGPYRRPDAIVGEGSGAADPVSTGPHVLPARFPDGQAAFEDLGTARDKAEFDKFLAKQRTEPNPPS